jgi:hypothetical protein
VEATLVTETHPAPGKAAGAIDPVGQAAIHLVFTTHAGDLRQYDYLANASLAAGAVRDIPAAQWIVTSDDSHHLQGVLVFETLVSETEEVQLTLRNLAGVPERTFLWAGGA